MRNFPKKLATAADLRNCKALVDDGTFTAEELLEAIDKLESTNYLHCPVQAVGEDRKSVTINYCAEATANTKAAIGGKTATINSVQHLLGEEKDGQPAQLEKTVLTLSAMVSADSDIAEISAPHSIYEEMGISASEVEKIKEELKNE